MGEASETGAGEGEGEGAETPRRISMPVGVVLRRSPGATRWARWVWRVVAVLPGAGPADWRELRREGDVVDYHAATVDLTLHRTDTEAYLIALSMTPPSVYVVLHPALTPEPGAPEGFNWTVHTVTASAHAALDHHESGEELVEPAPAPDGLVGWIHAFVEAHRKDEPFIKRQRNRWSTEEVEDGIGDSRVRQAADVYRAPASIRAARKGLDS